MRCKRYEGYDMRGMRSMKSTKGMSTRGMRSMRDFCKGSHMGFSWVHKFSQL